MVNSLGKNARCPGMLQAKKMTMDVCEMTAVQFGTGASPIDAVNHQTAVNAYDCSVLKNTPGYNNQYVFLITNHTDIASGGSYVFYFKDGDKIPSNVIDGIIANLHNEENDVLKATYGGSNDSIKLTIHNNSGSTYLAGGVLALNVLIPCIKVEY